MIRPQTVSAGPMHTASAWGAASSGRLVGCRPPNTTLADRTFQCKDTSFADSPCIHVGDDLNKTTFARSYHGDGVIVAMADGSVRFVSENVALPNWKAASTIAGGEVASLD